MRVIAEFMGWREGRTARVSLDSLNARLAERESAE